MVRPTTLEEAIRTVDSLKSAWDKAQPLEEASSQRLWRKLRLEWNYNSNHIEGNTLTYGETELLLIFGQTDGRHSIREFEEMKAHDVTIAHVREVAGAPRALTESDIRDLNLMILKEPFWKPAITIHGYETRKRIVPGEYKTSPNNVRTATGEIFHFADPLETPVKMRELVGWLQLRLATGDEHICHVISRLHHQFVLIHPFDDGNGRVARLLVNYVLMRAGFPPIVVKSRDKQNYLAALNQADTGNLDAFTLYLASEVIWSLDLGLRAASGGNIEEPDDLDKEIAVFAKQHGDPDNKAPMKSAEVLTQCSREVWMPLIDVLRDKMRPLAALFSRDELRVSQEWRGTLAAQFRSKGTRTWLGKTSGGSISSEVFSDFPILGTGECLLPHSYRIQCSWSGFSSPSTPPFDYETAMEIRLEEFSYSVFWHGAKIVHGIQFGDDECLMDRCRYDTQMTSATLEEVARTFTSRTLNVIQRLVQQSQK